MSKKIEKTHEGMIILLAYHADGILTVSELISWLSEFPFELLALLPDRCVDLRNDDEPCIKELVVELKTAVMNDDCEIICGATIR